ncbi:hypothetical protein OG275_17210 [Streptomyces niveus]|uniref:hypothetical protein n=1 Tax=Streptomyces niveus TaxID=193462 RepID=UPI002E3034BB|nr:hypothetical protein [Streptomyces niveus]
MADQRITTETGAGAHGRRWQALALLGVAQFMLILDVTVVAIALPHIGADLDLSRSALTWVVSAYTLTFGGLMLLGGRGADLFGARGSSSPGWPPSRRPRWSSAWPAAPKC